MSRLAGKHAIITGAGRGIGKAIAQKFLQEGAEVAICDLVQGRLEQAATDLEKHGDVHAFAGDVADQRFCDALVTQTLDRFGQLDILVNNAGIGYFKPFLTHSETEWDETMAVNLKSMFLLGQRAARVMKEQGEGGVILNMASTNGHAGEQQLAAYNASKAGVILLTKTMAAELGPYGIRVNCVSPGFILTELAREAGADEAYIAAYTEKIPLKRYGTPEDVANLYAFLASEEASFISGVSVIIDGGQLAEG
ncbi:MAG: SDR family oxidoreductase [Trueperaceae bacterium]|nr:MAG: SDR family oxidoreductase [Trueperaceae bacterium]